MKKIKTKKPIDVFYRNGEKYKENVINGYLICTKTGIRYYNLYANYDAKLDLKTGDCVPISSSLYKECTFKTVNEHLSIGSLLDNNYSVKTPIEILKEILIKKTTFESIHLCFNEAEKLSGNEKKEALKLAIYYQDLHEDSREMEEEDLLY